MDVDVMRLTPDEWELYRILRLEALHDAPEAFGSTLAREQEFDETTWRVRLETGTVFVARTIDADTAEPGGLIGTVYDADAGTHEVVSMWVRPPARGRKLAEPLVCAVLDRVAEAGGDAVHLWVTEPNMAARRLYERCGFTYTGRRMPLPSNPAVTELRMVYSV